MAWIVGLAGFTLIIFNREAAPLVDFRALASTFGQGVAGAVALFLLTSLKFSLALYL